MFLIKSIHLITKRILLDLNGDEFFSSLHLHKFTSFVCTSLSAFRVSCNT